MNTLLFCLGASSALVLVILVALVVVVAGLNKKVSKYETDLRDVSNTIDTGIGEVYRVMEDRLKDLNHLIAEEKRLANEAAKSYTDSRIDKVLLNK